MMTGESSSSSTTQDSRRQALTAYLEPLLQKHEKGETITYEDLMSSKQAADNITKEATATKVIEELHTSQLAAYRTAATTALQEWATATDQFTIPQPQPDESWSEYRQRWWTTALAAAPAWKVDNKESIIKPILQGKALALYNAKQRKTAEAAQKKVEETAVAVAVEVVDSLPDKNNNKNNKSDDTEKMEEGEEEEENEQEREEGEEEEGEDGEVEKDEDEEEEEGEIEEEEEDGEVSNEKIAAAAPPRKQQQVSKAKANKSTASIGTAKQALKKKNQATKPKRGTARRGRGRGRGGANSAK